MGDIRTRYRPGMARDNKLDALSSVRLFAGLNRRELATVAKASDAVSAAAGTTIVAEGSAGREFYLLLDGTATVRRNGRKVATLGPGDYFGEMALLDARPRSATVEAASDVSLLVIGPREFAAVLQQVPAVARKLLIGLAGRLRDADAKAFSH